MALPPRCPIQSSARFSRAGRRPRRVAFTLIEVLVVVAIIALLAAILIPSLQQARNQARASVCASNMKQLLNGTLMHIVSQGPRAKDRVSTNLGWAVFTFKQNSSETDLYSCPSDPNPWPIPALFDRYYGTLSTDGRYHDATVSSDGVFNRTQRMNNTTWRLKVEDLVEGREFGNDVNDPAQFDLLLEYRVIEGQQTAMVEVVGNGASLTHKVMDHRGQTVWPHQNDGFGDPRPFKVLWMSYGANASAGLRGVKGSPALLVESAKPGVFPEQLRGRNSMNVYPNDHLAAHATIASKGTPLRFFHGDKSTDPRLRPGDFHSVGGVLPTGRDSRIDSRSRMNVGFLDGHVERMHFAEMIGDYPTVDTNGDIRWHRSLWRGIGRRTDDPSFY